MSMIEEEITDFILKNTIEIEEVNHDTCLKWEKLRYFDSIIDKDGWSYINEFVSDNACIMFFNEFDEKKMFKIKNGNDLYFLLSETSGFEFYITDSNYSYLICFNHHDILYGCGKASYWVDKLKKLDRN